MFKSLRRIAGELEELECVERQRLEQDKIRNEILKKIESKMGGTTHQPIATLLVNLGTPVAQ